jgi:hypothetical protein
MPDGLTKDLPHDRLSMPIWRYEVKLKILRRCDRSRLSRPFTAQHSDDPTDSPLAGYLCRKGSPATRCCPTIRTGLLRPV